MNKLNHIAFIMDGNGRWGKKNNKGRNFGHLNGVETVKKIVKESKSIASRPVATTAPSKETTQVLTEGFEQANRWKKLAGLK